MLFCLDEEEKQFGEPLELDCDSKITDVGLFTYDGKFDGGDVGNRTLVSCPFGCVDTGKIYGCGNSVVQKEEPICAAARTTGIAEGIFVVKILPDKKYYSLNTECDYPEYAQTTNTINNADIDSPYAIEIGIAFLSFCIYEIDCLFSFEHHV